jgi:hypothetical protein
MTTATLQLPQGSIALRMRIFGLADEELADTIAPPWPRWMRRLFELQSLQSSRVDTLTGEVGVSAALAALEGRIVHRLHLIIFIAAHLEELGWELEASGSDLIAHKVTAASMARESLETHHLLSALIAVGDVDEKGGVRLYTPGELAVLPSPSR